MRIISVLVGLAVAVPAAASAESDPANEVLWSASAEDAFCEAGVLSADAFESLRFGTAPGEGLREIEEVGRIEYTVAPGDTLSRIAANYEVSIAQIRRWNPRLNPDRLSVGQELILEIEGESVERSRDEYVVESGDTALGIALAHDVTLDQLRRWNPRFNPDRIRVGQRITIYTERRRSSGSSSSGAPSQSGQSQAVGAPNRGRLRNADQLETGPGYRVRNPVNSYATTETITRIREGMARVKAHRVNAPDLVVGDLSTRRGGRFPPHRSHQNGMDADIAFYQRDAGRVCRLVAATPETLDVELNWYLFRTWIEESAVQFIFVNYELQEPLYEYAQARGASDEQLEEWFQYPRGRNSSRGIIRHEPGHDDHFHVRFR